MLYWSDHFGFFMFIKEFEYFLTQSFFCRRIELIIRGYDLALLRGSKEGVWQVKALVGGYKTILADFFLRDGKSFYLTETQKIEREGSDIYYIEFFSDFQSYIGFSRGLKHFIPEMNSWIALLDK